MNALETRVLERIGENTASPDVFVDTDTGMAPIRDSLNDAIEEINMIAGGINQEYYINLQANKPFYRIDIRSGQMAWVTDVWYVDIKRRLEQTDVTRLTGFNPRWMVNTGSPESYFMIGTKAIGFWPKPAAAGVIRVEFSAIPDRYKEDIDRISLRDSFQWAATHFAVSEYWASRGDARTALAEHGKYLEKMGLESMYPQAAERQWGRQTTKEPWPKSTD